MASKNKRTASPGPETKGGRRFSPRILVGAAVVLVIAVAAIVALRLTAGGGLRFGPDEDPDIILVTIDTLRTDGVSFTGSERVKTPFLDEIAGGGVYFENAHAHNVVTFPSHTNMLTGLLPYQHGVRDNAGFILDPQHKTIAHALKERGYATGAFVAAFPLDARVGLTPAFDVYDDDYPEGTGPSAFVVPERRADEVVAVAQKWYDSVGDQKRFMWVHVYEPHVPHEPRSPWKELYADPYYAEVAEVDDILGRFIRPLLERRPNTLLIITSDHGEGQGEHGEITHGLFAYEETLKVPLMVYEKGRIKPRREKSFVSHIDIVPTILARLGIAKPLELTGASLLEIKEPRNTYFEALTASLNLGWAPLVGLIHEGHKYVDLPIAELYDLASDPGEKNNILTENRRMTTKIRKLLAAAAPGAAASADRNVSEEEAQKLLSLGYLAGTAAAKKEYTEDDDPKKLVPFYSRMNSAVSHYQNGEWKQAIEVAETLLAERPEMTMLKDLLAFVLQQTEQPDKAEKLLRDAIAEGTASDTMKKRLGLLLSEQGEAQEAVQILSQFKSSKDPELLNAYGIALADLGQIREAVEQFEKSLQIDPRNATAFQNLGIVALRAGDLDRSKQYLGRALALSPELPLALNTLGVVLAREKDFPRAIEAWKRAVAADPRQFDAMFNMGLVAMNIGQRDVAREALTKFVETAPKERYAADIARARQALAALR
ncbi:MAG TPA: tetratricopeptide repeat protein [Thermoanaerobaculia bacterium]